MTDTNTQTVGAVGNTVATNNIHAVLDRVTDVQKLDAPTLDKMSSLLRSSAANNGVCGWGCYRAMDTIATKE